MTTVQPSYQTPPLGPVSPFSRAQGPGNTQPMPPSPFQGDTAPTQTAPKGIPPKMDMFREQQSKLSPFHRPDGKPVDQIAMLESGAKTSTQAMIPAETPKNDGPLVFYFPKDIPTGPALQNIEQLMQQELQQVQAPQQAVQIMGIHIQAAATEREWTNRITWGAKFHAVQAAELAEQALAQRPQMSAEQLQAVKTKIAEQRDKAVSLLNESKKHAINTYNELLKAGLTYNHFFTAAGQFNEQLDDPSREAIKGQLDEGWKRWNGTFAKEWQGQMAQADGASLLIDKTSHEVSEHLHRMNSVLSQI